LERVQPVAAEPHYHGQHHHHQHQERANESHVDSETERDVTHNGDFTLSGDSAQDVSVFEHSVFDEDTRTFEFEEEEEENWIDATPSTTSSSDIERHEEIRRQTHEINSATTSTDHSVRKLYSLSLSASKGSPLLCTFFILRRSSHFIASYFSGESLG
jgi:hypothetical protein